MNIVFLIIGLILILVGANLLTDGSASLAKRWGVSDLVVGLTVVAFGTSAPELVISITSSIHDNAGLAIGNVVGSNIFNVCAIVGVTALVRPMNVEKGLLSKDIPLVVLSSLVLLAMGNSPLLDGAPAAVLSRGDGILLLLFFIIFLRYSFAQAAEKSGEGEIDKDIPAEEETKILPLWKSTLWILLGLAGLIYGGDRFVAGASGIASSLGVSDAVIGLTIVAAGTSLPELATSVAAALKGNTGIAIGNVIGSCIFNAFMVLGCAAVIRPLPFGSIGNFDLLVMTGGCILFWIFGRFYGDKVIKRSEGAILAACYIAYVAALIYRL